MRERLINFAFMVAALVTVSVFDSRTSTAQHLLTPAWAQTSSDIPADSNIIFGVLPNGMMYAIQRNTTPPGQTALRFMIRAGSMHEAEDQQGLAHFLEHMAFRGSTNVPDGEVKNKLERLGLRFGADTNAITNQQRTTFAFDLTTSMRLDRHRLNALRDRQ